MFFCKQKIIFILPVFKNIANLLFGYFGPAWLCTSKLKRPPSRKLSYLPGDKKHFDTRFSGDIAKILKRRILGTLGMPGYTHTI